MRRNACAMVSLAFAACRVAGLVCSSNHSSAAVSDVQPGEREEDRAPAVQFAEPAGNRRRERDAEHVADEEARQHRLAALVGHHVADPGDGERHDRAHRGAGREARRHQQRQRRRESAGEVARRRYRRDPEHHAVLADAVAQRAVDDLQRAVGDRERGDHRRGAARGGAEGFGEQRQQRIHGAQRRGAREGRECEDDDGARAVGDGRAAAQRSNSFNACSRSFVFCTLPLAVMPMASKSSTMRR